MERTGARGIKAELEKDDVPAISGSGFTCWLSNGVVSGGERQPELRDWIRLASNVSATNASTLRPTPLNPKLRVARVSKLEVLSPVMIAGRKPPRRSWSLPFLSRERGPPYTTTPF
jgi:hypothetical protein